MLVYIAGETVIYGRLAQVLERVWGRENYEKEEWSVETLKSELAKDPGERVEEMIGCVFGQRGRAAWSWSEEKDLQRRAGFEIAGCGGEWVTGETCCRCGQLG